MYYLTTYWFSAQNSNSYLLKEKVLDINTLCSLWRHYQYTNITHVITHMNFLHVIPTESQSCLFSSCNSTHTHALHLPYKCCTKPFPTWAKVQPHLMLDATLALLGVTMWALLLEHTQPHCFSQDYRCSSQGNRLLSSHTLLLLCDFWNRKLHCQSYEKETILWRPKYRQIEGVRSVLYELCCKTVAVWQPLHICIAGS